jgi:ribosomal protein S18 acetylase RimI-like enzyme
LAASSETWSHRAGERTLQGRLLGESDLPALIGLHHRVLAALPDGILNAETDEFFAQHVFESGRLLGVETGDGEIVAYAVLGLPTASSSYNFGRDINLPLSELGAVAHLDGIGVDAAWRGHGLQRALSQRRTAIAVAAGRRHMITTVAPNNLHSLSNLLALGFNVVATRPMFAASHIRHLLHLDASKPTVAPAPELQKTDPLARPSLLAAFGPSALSGDAA